MARIPRSLIIGDGCLFHVTWQCHNKSWLLNSRWAKRLYYNLLLRFKDTYEITFFSHTVMDNHIHLSGQMKTLKQLSDFFRVVNSMFAKELNRQKGRYGQVVRDRFKSPCLQSEQDLIREMIYHDLNEVRAGKSKHPQENELSSYAHYAHGKPDPLVMDAEIYLQMGNTPLERQIAYRAMVEEVLTSAPLKKDGRYTQAMYIGNPQWVAEKYEKLKAYRAELKTFRRSSSLSPPG